MSVSYRTLFTVELLHRYFADGRCKVLMLAPTAECRRLLDRYRLVFRPAPNGGTVSWTVHPEIDFLALFNETRPFAFNLACTDPLFGHYTAMDATAESASPSETLFYFDNLGGGPSDRDATAQCLLHPSGRPFANGALPVRTGGSRLEFDPPLQKATLKVIDPLNQQAVRQFRTPDADTRMFPLDLSGLPEGCYLLAVNRRKPVPFYLRDLPAVRHWGIAEIYAGGSAMGDAVPAACRVIDPAGRPEPKTFAVSFDNRRTIWRYHVFSAAPQERGYGSAEIAGLARNGDGGPIAFVRSHAPMAIEGRDAWIFESEQPVPLWQAPAEKHIFTLKTNGRGQTVTLPYAESGGTRLDGEGAAKKMVSEIFVYL